MPARATAVLCWGTDAKEALPGERKGPLTCGGAKGTRTPNPLLAKQVRYQLRHGPENTEPARTRRAGGIRDETRDSALRGVRGLGPELVLGLLGRDLLRDRERADGRRSQQKDLLHGVHHLGSEDRVVGLTGLEPVASSLSGKRSNRLSYRPVHRDRLRHPRRVARCTRLPHHGTCTQNGPDAATAQVSRRSG